MEAASADNEDAHDTGYAVLGDIADVRAIRKGQPVKITLTPDIEGALAEEARRQGTTPELLALATLRERFVSPRANEAAAEAHGTLADYLADHIGVLSSAEHVPGGAAMSEKCGRVQKANLVRRERIVTRDKDILGGTPVFTGTRVPIDTLIVHLKAGHPLDKFLDDFPSVSREQAEAFLELAQHLIVEEAMDACPVEQVIRLGS